MNVKSSIEQLQDDIARRMDAIIAALKEKPTELEKIIQAYADLGQYLQDCYPGEKVDSIQKKLAYFIKYHSVELPPLKLHAVLSEARVRAHEQVGALEDPQEIVLMNSLSKGIALFGTLMGADRVAQKTAEYEVTEKEIESSKDAINNNILYPHRLSVLDNALNEMSKSYNELYEGTGKHKDSMTHLLKDIKRITTDNDLDAVKKYDQVIQLLREQFEKLEADYKRENKESPMKGLFTYRPDSFINYINKKSDDHLYSRMIGVLLRDLYIQRYAGTGNEMIADKMINQLNLDKLIIPNTAIYRGIRLIQSEAAKTSLRHS